MGLTAASFGSSNTRGLFAGGALAPSSRSGASTRFGSGDRVSIGDRRAGPGSVGMFGVVRNLREVRELKLEQEALVELGGRLHEMRELSHAALNVNLTGAQRAHVVDQLRAVKDQLTTLATDRARGYSLASSRSLPSYVADDPAAAKAASQQRVSEPLRLGPQTTIGVVTSQTVVRDTETVMSTITTRVRVPVVSYQTVTETNAITSTTVDGALSTVNLGGTYGAKQVSALNFSAASPDHTFSLTKVGYAYSAQDTAAGGLLSGATLDTNLVTSINVQGAAWGHEFKFEKVGNTLVKLTNQTTGETQTLDIAAEAGQTGAKTVTWSQLGVSVSLNGLGQSGPDKLASAFHNKKVYTKLATNQWRTVHDANTGGASRLQFNKAYDTNTLTTVDVTGATAGREFKIERVSGSTVKITDKTSLQSQQLDISALAGQSGAKTLNFNELNVRITFTGAAQSGVDEFAKAIDNKVIWTAATPDYSMKLTNVTTGQSQTISMNGFGEATASQLLNFDQLGVSMTLGGGSTDTGVLVNSLSGGSVVTKEVTTYYETQREVEVITEEEQDVVIVVATEVEHLYITTVSTEYAVTTDGALRMYDSVATEQAAPTVARGDQLSGFRQLEQTLTKELAAVEQRSKELQGKIDELSAGSPTNLAEARGLVTSIVQNVLKAYDAHSMLTGAMVADLLTQDSGPRTSTQPAKPAPKPAPKPAEPEPAKSP